MKLQSKLALAFAGTLVVAAIAGCPTGTPSPVATPTTAPTATPIPTMARLFIQKMMFKTAAGATQGNHSVFIKNGSDAAISDLDKYVIAYHPTGTNAVATSSILNQDGTKVTALSKGGSMEIFLYSTGTPSVGTQAETTFNDAVQYSAGGGLAVFKDAATTSANITDFVQWGRTSSNYQDAAVGAKLWTNGSTVATVSIASKAGAELNVVTEKATGSTNFTFTTF